MSLNPIWVFPLFLFFLMANSEEQAVRKALVKFMDKLAPPGNNNKTNQRDGWNLTSDPCTDKWQGVTCYSDNHYVKSIILEELGFSGVVDATSLCKAKSLQILSLSNNNLHGLISEDIANCKFLTHLFLNGNKFSGNLPVSIAKLSNLKRLYVSDNHFTGQLPKLVNVSGLISFLAENNNFTGDIPVFDFSNLDAFNVSNNKLWGPVPDVRGRFHADSFYGNPALCGKPLSNSSCPPPPPPLVAKKVKNSFRDDLPLYSGYIILGLIVLLFLIFKLLSKLIKTKEKAADAEKKDMGMAQETSGGDRPSETSNSKGSKNWLSGIGIIRSECNSLTSLESGMMTTTSGLVLLSSRRLRGLQFEDLLSAPAELIRRGKHGSLYKVMLENGVMLAVKRIKDWGISKQEFEIRMNLIAQVKQHPCVMPPVAYYCSQQEKLLAYEYLQNGSLFMLLYGKWLTQVSLHPFKYNKVIS